MVAVAGGLLAVPLSVEAHLGVALFHTESQRSVLFMVSRYDDHQHDCRAGYNAEAEPVSD